MFSYRFHIIAMEFIRPVGLVDLAKLGLAWAGKQLGAQVQQKVVAAHADNHAKLRPDCRSCVGRCHVKDWLPHRLAHCSARCRSAIDRLSASLTPRQTAG